MVKAEYFHSGSDEKWKVVGRCEGQRVWGEYSKLGETLKGLSLQIPPCVPYSTEVRMLLSPHLRRAPLTWRILTWFGERLKYLMCQVDYFEIVCPKFHHFQESLTLIIHWKLFHLHESTPQFSMVCFLWNVIGTISKIF